MIVQIHKISVIIMRHPCALVLSTTVSQGVLVHSLFKTCKELSQIVIRGGIKNKFLKLTKYLCSVKMKSQRLLDQKKVKCLFGDMCVHVCEVVSNQGVDYLVDNS